MASALPWILANDFGVANVAEPGQLPDSVKLAFYLGAIVFLGAVLWTVVTTKEYSPVELASIADRVPVESLAGTEIARTPAQHRKAAVV